MLGDRRRPTKAMTLTRLVLEHGIELRNSPEGWRLPTCPERAPMQAPSLEQLILPFAPLRAVLATMRLSAGTDRAFILRAGTGQPIGIATSTLTQGPLDPGMLMPNYHVAYLLGAVEYHCERMADFYAQIAERYYAIELIPGCPPRNDTGIFGFQTGPYYEFDSLLGAAKRAYDSLRFVLWKRFGSTKGDTPRSLEALLRTSIPLPTRLRARLEESWAAWGVPVTEYRDCVHHYVPVDFGMASAFMRRHSTGAWTTMMRIPDNPKARSTRKFTYTRNLDALSYGWLVAEELIGLALEAGAPDVDAPTSN